MENLNTQVFLEVVKTGSFKKAAENLGYTQAGIAYIINALEKAWRIRLFHRAYGGVRLTEEGKLLLPLIQQINNQERQLTQKVSEINHLQAGLIRIVAFEVIFIHWMPDIVAAFRKDFPQITFDFITCEDRHAAARMVYEGDADLGFFIPPISKPLESIPLLEEPMMALVSPQHPLAKQACFPVSQIDCLPFIATKDDENSELTEIFETLGVRPHPSFTVESDYANMAFVSKNLGFSIFSRTAAQNAPFHLKALPFDKSVTRTITLGLKSFDESSEIIKTFIAYTRRFLSC